MQVRQLDREIINIISRNMDNCDQYKVFLYGTCALLRDNDRIDYDVGIDAEKRIAQETLDRIKKDLESLPISRKIYIIDFSRVSDELKNIVLETAIELS